MASCTEGRALSAFRELQCVSKSRQRTSFRTRRHARVQPNDERDKGSSTSSEDDDDASPAIAIIVPFREQPGQDRRSQLKAFQERMADVLRGARFLVIIAEQTVDGCAFNRGALLNAGYLEARKLAPLASVILHDVDLLPSNGLRQLYLQPPRPSMPMHLAGPSSWAKYADMAGYEEIFFGGVTALHPPDFERCNGYPNNYWGWGMEDDQLRMRVQASGGLAGGVRRPPAGMGSYRDLDAVAMLGLLNSRETLARHAHSFNPRMFGGSDARGRLDAEWQTSNGLRGLRYKVLHWRKRRLCADATLIHMSVAIPQSEAERERAAVLAQAMRMARGVLEP